jgi:peptide/nickel transport system permease protein
MPDEEPALASVWRSLLASPEGRIGIGLAVIVFGLIGFGRFFVPYSPEAIGVGPPIQGPSGAHLLGTDTLGRDIFSRFLSGGDTILVVPLIAVSAAYVLGGGLGMLGGFRRGILDTIITRIFDLLLTLPPLLLVLVLIAGLGTSKLILVVTVALVFLPRVGRILRGATQAVVTNDYVSAAQARGEWTGAIIFWEVLPNIVAPALADYTLRLTYAIIFVASLNFLGLGAQPPTPDWGVMVYESRGLLSINPIAALAPAGGIVALSIAFSLIGEALTRHLTRETRAVAL